MHGKTWLQTTCIYFFLAGAVVVGFVSINDKMENIAATMASQQKQIVDQRKQISLLQRKLRRRSTSYSELRWILQGKSHARARLKTWDAHREAKVCNAQLPSISEITVKDVDLSGEWKSYWSDIETTMIFLGVKEKFFVLLHTRGSLAEWQLERIARFQDGVIQFDKPVVEYMTQPYSTLYAIKYQDKVLLVPSFWLEKVNLSRKKQERLFPGMVFEEHNKNAE